MARRTARAASRSARRRATTSAAPTSGPSRRGSGAQPGRDHPGQLHRRLPAGHAGRRTSRTQLADDTGGDLEVRLWARAAGLRGRQLSGAKTARLARHPNVVSIEPDRVAGAGGHPEPGDLGPGSHRPAQPAAGHDSYADGTEGAGVHAYMIDTGIRGHARRVRRPDGQRLRRRHRRRQRQRLQRPRHARRRHGRRHDLRRRRQGDAARRARAGLQRLRRATRASSPASTGCGRTRSSRPSRT